MKIRLEFKPADCWVGLYWRTDPPYWRSTRPPYPKDRLTEQWVRTHVWICLLPMFPIHVSWDRQQA